MNARTKENGLRKQANFTKRLDNTNAADSTGIFESIKSIPGEFLRETDHAI